MVDSKTTNPFQRHEADTGSPESQIWNLTQEIAVLQGHLKTNPKDFDAKRRLLKSVAKRRRFLKYIKKSNLDTYNKISKKIGLKV